MKRGIVINIDEETKRNTFFRKVLFTAEHSQLVAMSLNPGEEIGEEVHPENDQFIRVEAGVGKAVLEGESFALTEEYALLIPAGTKHNIVNTSSEGPLKLYTLYAPAHHRDGTVHETKEDALRAEASEA